MQTDAMYLRGEYFRTSNENLKRISIRLNKLAVESVDFNVTPHKMADISRELLCKIDVSHFIEQRIANYRYLQENIKNTKIELLCEDLSRLTTAPLYFIIYTTIREELQSQLCSHHIYAPIIWPVYYRDVLINKTTEEIYNETLAIPIDQRYDKSDMEKIVNVLNNC
jgi:dTDP-4-amino-4,6-dideoxygalactose transaminase